MGRHPAAIRAQEGAPRRRRVLPRAPRQLLIGHSFGLVPETMSRNPEWLLPLRRALKAVDATQLFHSLDRGEGAQEVRRTLDRGVKQVMERAGQVVTVYKKGSLAAACKGSYRTGKLRATQNIEDWCVWASRAAIEARTEDGDRMDRLR
jgi:hypothetical protein